jgi:hypothetical protein
LLDGVARSTSVGLHNEAHVLRDELARGFPFRAEHHNRRPTDGGSAGLFHPCE